MKNNEKRVFMALLAKQIKLGDEISKLENEGASKEVIDRKEKFYRKVLRESIDFYESCEHEKIFN